MSLITHGPIVGATTANSVTIWMRTDDACKVEVRLVPHLNSLPADYSQTVNVPYVEDQDFTRVVTIKDLLADTHYDYEVLVNGTRVLPDGDAFKILSFRTFPEPGTAVERFSFTFGSCFRPHSVDIGDQIFTKLAPSGEEVNPDPRFFLMIGDNVYVDDYYDRCLAGKDQQPGAAQTLQQFYYDAYQDSWECTNFRYALMNTPTFMIFDDHEFWNNWRNEPGHHFDVEGYPLALKAFQVYQDNHNPDALDRQKKQPVKYHYTFSYGDVGFFVLDCRTRRNPMATPFRTILGREQREELIDWLVNNNERFRVKFIVSSVPVTFIALPHWFVKLFHGGLGDQWLGYPTERRILFEAIKEKKISGVHFLSGDIHLGQGVEIKPDDGESPPVYSFTASPLANVFSLLPEEAPSWASALSGGLIGAFVGLLVAIFDLFNSTLSVIWGIFWGVLFGAIAGELLRRFLNFWRPPSEHNKPGRIGTAVYEVISKLVQKNYIRRLLGVAKDGISVKGATYKPENIFAPVFEPNIGRVTVTRLGEAIEVKFTLLVLDKEAAEQNETAHFVD